MLVGACNECPCGARAGLPLHDDVEIARYYRRLSGPLLDRIDLICTVSAAAARRPRSTRRDRRDEPSAPCASRVVAARERQAERLAGTARAVQRADGRPAHPRATSARRASARAPPERDEPGD